MTSEDESVHRVPVVVFVEVRDAIDVKDARRIAASAVNDHVFDLESFSRGQNTWPLRVARTATLLGALARGWITLYSSERAYGLVDPHDEEILARPRKADPER